MDERTPADGLSVQESARYLARAVTALELDALFAPATPAQLEALQARVPLTADLIAWYTTAAPQMPVWLLQAGNDLELYAFKDIVERNHLYTEDAHESWQTAWTVIGDIGGDPVVVDTTQAGSPVLTGMHGMGEWTLHVIAPTLGQYLHALGCWVEACLLGTSAAHEKDYEPAHDHTWVDHIWDEDGNYLPEIADSVRRALSPILPEEALVWWLE